MIERILEPEVMDSEDEAQEYDSMDHSEVNRAFVRDFLAVHKKGWKLLDVGTGTALIPIELCQNEPRAIVLGVDASEAMLRRGAKNVAAAGLVGRVSLSTVDAKGLSYDAGSFPGVISNSIIHHIEYPERVMREMVRVMSPGATLFVRDLLRPDDHETLDGLVQTYAGAANESQKGLFRDSLHAALSLDEMRQLCVETGIDPASVAQTTDRHWTMVWIKPD